MVCRDVWETVKRRFLKIGLRSKSEVESKLHSLPYYRFPGVVRQQLTLIRAINKRRKRAGLPSVRLARNEVRRQAGIATQTHVPSA